MEHSIYNTEDCRDDEFAFDDERRNLDKNLDGRIVVIADLGLWDGRHWGYKTIGWNLGSVLAVAQGDDFRLYYDSETDDVKMDDHHHDGTNHYTFRETRKGKDIEPLLDLIYAGKQTDEDIAKYTKPLGKYVRKIYGWKKAARK